MKFSQLLTVEQNTPGNELEGTPAENWSEVRDVMALVTPLTGREYQLAQQMQSNATHTIRTRFFQGADSRMRLRRGSRIFNVESVINEREENRFLVWSCVEVV